MGENLQRTHNINIVSPWKMSQLSSIHTSGTPLHTHSLYELDSESVFIIQKSPCWQITIWKDKQKRVKCMNTINLAGLNVPLPCAIPQIRTRCSPSLDQLSGFQMVKFCHAPLVKLKTTTSIIISALSHLMMPLKSEQLSFSTLGNCNIFVIVFGLGISFILLWFVPITPCICSFAPIGTFPSSLLLFVFVIIVRVTGFSALPLDSFFL